VINDGMSMSDIIGHFLIAAHTCRQHIIQLGAKFGANETTEISQSSSSLIYLSAQSNLFVE
jgi:ATP/maltotriose-dependent transcriptional regulator MalT